MFTEDFKTELSAIKKINQIGKKVVTSGNYVLYKGLIFGFEKNTCVSITELDEKLKYQFWTDCFMKIDGNELYRLLSKGKFKGYKNTDKGLELVFEVEEEVQPEFILDEFVNYCEKYGYTKFDVVVASGKGWDSDFGIYKLYTQYKKSLLPYKGIVDKTTIFEYVDEYDEVVNKVIRTMTIISSSKCMFKRKISQDTFDKIMNSDGPFELFYFYYGEKKKFSIMKSMMPLVSKSSELSYEIDNCDRHTAYAVIEILNDNIRTMNIFRIVRF